MSRLYMLLETLLVIPVSYLLLKDIKSLVFVVLTLFSQYK